MAATGYTPIQLYHSSSAGVLPTAGNLLDGELALNITDGKLYYKDGSTVKLLASNSSTGGTFTAPVVIEGSTTDAALRVTQTGTGNALLVEDSANPDSTPFVIDASGHVILGATQSYNAISAFGYGLQNYGVDGSGVFGRFSADVNGPLLDFVKSRNASVGGQTVVSNGDTLGAVRFGGSDGTALISAAQILAAVDGTPGTNDMPGRLIFSTTADGASSPTERMRIDSAGRIGIGSAPTASYSVVNFKQLTGATTEIGYGLVSTIQSDVTTLATGYRSNLSTQATAFTLGSLYHFEAVQSTIGAGSSVTNQYGFVVGSTLTGATNNYGFFGAIAAGTGRYNFYAAGTADNYMAGSLGIGVAASAGVSLNVQKSLTGSTTSTSVNTTAAVQSDVTGQASGFQTYLLTAASAFTLTSLKHYNAIQGAFGAGSTVTNQYGFVVDSSLTGAANNYGFYGNIASGTGRYNLYMAGTADNYLAGSLGIGATLTQVNFYNTRNISGNTISYGNYLQATVQSDVTSAVHGYRSNISTAATSFSVGSIYNFYVGQGTIGAGSSVTNQYGFVVDSSLTGATNNYGFYGNIASGSGRYNFYAAGTAANYFAGTIQTASAIVSSRINPRTLTTTSTATLAPDVSAYDQYNLTAQAAALAVSAPIGTPVDGNKLTFRILDNGTSRAITWNATYTAIGVTLPTATTAGKMTYVGCIYNDTNTRWDVVAVSTQA